MHHERLKRTHIGVEQTKSGDLFTHKRIMLNAIFPFMGIKEKFHSLNVSDKFKEEPQQVMYSSTGTQKRSSTPKIEQDLVLGVWIYPF